MSIFFFFQAEDGIRDPGRGLLTYEGVPGLVETKEAHGETTLVVDPARLLEACAYLRDEQGFAMLVDVAAADYLGWGRLGVSGYIGTAGGRDLNSPMTQGYQKLPEGKPKRFSMSYHLLALETPSRRVRLQIWLDEGEPCSSVIDVWPTADWHEREAWDMMGINVV